MIKLLPKLAALLATLPIVATAGEWHIISDEVNPGVPIKGGFVVGAVPVESIKIAGDHVDAEVAMFYAYDLAIEAKAKILGSHSDPTWIKMKAAIDAGRANTYLGSEHAFGRQFGVQVSSADDMRALLVASEVIVDQGLPRIVTRTIHVRCFSRTEFSYSFDGAALPSDARVTMPSNGSGDRGSMLPFICDKVGMGQNQPAPPPPPDADMVQLDKISQGLLLPKWKFLGIKDDQYQRRTFVFFGADTIKNKPMYTDVIVGYWQAVSGISPEKFIAEIQDGERARGNLAITHVHCDSESIDENFSGAKLYETQLVTYVCAHRH